MSKGTDMAAGALGTAAMAANAIPVGGQFAAIGLGIASGLTKLFGSIDGPRKKKKRRRRQAAAAALQRQQASAAAGATAGMAGAGGQLNTGGQMPALAAPSPQPPTPMFNPNNPGVTPQQTLHGTE